MYSDRKTKKGAWVLLALAVIVVIALAAALLSTVNGSAMKESSAAAIRETVERSARQCYAVEGVYPPDLAYLRDNYGLQINTDDYYVSYDIYATNVPPSVKVVVK